MKAEDLRILRDVLSLVNVRVSLKTLRSSWTEQQRKEAERWASLTYLRASDHPVKVPRMPQHVAACPRADGLTWGDAHEK